MPRSWATINLSSLEHNFRVCQAAAPDCSVMAMVKANAYGHGLVEVARQLSAIEGVTPAAFAVAHIGEGVQLREAGIEQPIVILSDFSATDQLFEITKFNLSVVVYNEHQIQMLESNSALGPVGVWLKVDTGMHRLGFSPEAASGALERLLQCPGTKPVVRLLSHFANADTPSHNSNVAQIDRFDSMQLPGSFERSMANSAGLFAFERSHFDWVRPGISLYGASPFVERSLSAPDLRPVMTLHATVIDVAHRQRGERLGYGGQGECKRDSVIATVGIGYGDGYPRHAAEGTPVLINGERAPLIGRVSMDMIMVDVTECLDVSVGNDVVLWGDGLPVEIVAGHAGTISYELLTGLSSRVRFSYIDE